MNKTNNIENLDPKHFIIIKGARVHNLKNVDIAFPRNKFIVVTGLSGSGKSSLAFDTLYAEGQRRYVESLSAYARQFLGKIEKPDIDYIKGIAPAIAIEQKVNTRNPRSTVGTTTEIYDYLKLLFARIGKTFSPVSGNEVKRDTREDVLNFILSLPKGTKVALYAPLILKNNRTILEELKLLLQQGFSRIRYKNEIVRIEEFDDSKASVKDIAILIDRLTTDTENEDNTTRIYDSIQTAFYEGNGECIVEIHLSNEVKEHRFNNRFELDGITFEEPSVNFFSFNNPIGACKYCEGYGSVIGIDEDLVIPNKSLSIYEDAIVCWKGDKMSEWKNQLIKHAHKFNFPIHRPYNELHENQRKLLWTGNNYFSGLNDFFKHLEEQSYKIQYRVLLSRYRGKTKCPECNGSRLRKDAGYVKINNHSIIDIVLMSVSQARLFFENIKLNKYEQEVAKRLLIEIKNRLKFLEDVGLGYLSLNRLSNTLSGGESQRINLTTALGSSLVGSMYILDEPSIGLHSRDTQRLIEILKSLRNVGNTVIVVEHDEDIIKAADEIVDMGPLAGSHGGEVVFQGKHEELLNSQISLTAKYLTEREKIEIPPHRRKWKKSIHIKGARENNLKNINVNFPLNILTVVTGVSGSGKSSLVKKVLYTALKKQFGAYGERTGLFDQLSGDVDAISGVEFIDQNPIGKSTRSNPVTYLKAYDEIRDLFTSLPLAKVRNYKPAYFSFNVDGGRCEMCEGEGIIKVEMQFMADVHLTCDACHGKRFKDEILEIEYHGKNVYDILEMTIDDAIDFFNSHKSESKIETKIIEKLKPLQDVGLGYVKLGQSSSTLSGGEAQRIKLASFIGKGKSLQPLLFIFDEPTTGLHFHDVKKLLSAFDALIENGHSLVVIEHNLDIVKCADWVIDLGPEGGDEGGTIVFEGIPDDLIKCKNSYTGKYLKEKLVKKK
ncbi:MAG: excinuclease ABC subunit UvrA [Bacteroidia bacterium]